MLICLLEEAVKSLFGLPFSTLVEALILQTLLDQFHQSQLVSSYKYCFLL